MNGKDDVRFSDLFADTVRAHGWAWAHAYYTKRGMPAWEYAFWVRTIRPGVRFAAWTGLV